MSQTPELQDYILLFESEPEWVHAAGWWYGARFVLQRGGDTLIATLAPDEAEFHLRWLQGSRCLLDLQLVMVTQWSIQHLRGTEQLRLQTSADREQRCTITLKPEVAVELDSSW